MQSGEKGIRDFYDATARDWADRWYSNELLLPLLTDFVALLGPKPRILDAGCGAGYESMRLHGLGADVVGVDFSEESIRIAAERNPGCSFHVMDARRIGDALGLFDGIAAIALIVHFEEGELPGVFEGFRKALRPGGYLLLAFVEGEGFCARRSYVEVNGERYNRAMYCHKKDSVVQAALPLGFAFHAEWFLPEPAGDWRYILLRAR